MARTNIEINDRLIKRAMRLYGLRTKRETVDFALRELVGRHQQRDMLDMRGSGWEGDLDALRESRPA